MADYLRTKIEETQFTSLVNAISSGGGSTHFDYIDTGVYGLGCTILDGGYCKLGNMVFVQFRVQTLDANQFEIHNVPKSRFTIPLSVFNGSQGANVTVNSYITSSGLIRTISNNYQNGDVVVISGCYLESEV